MSVSAITSNSSVPQRLQAWVTLHGPAAVLRGRGDVSPGTADQWQVSVDHALGAVRPHGTVVVDLTDFVFDGGCGIDILADAQRRCLDTDRVLTIAGAGPLVVDQLHRCPACADTLAYSSVAVALARMANLRRRTAVPAPDDGGGYENLAPLFRRLRAYPEDSDERKRLREHIIERALPLAAHIAYRFGDKGEMRDDLIQVARLGLLRAVDRFDVSVGPDFLSFAIPTIMGEVRRHFRDRTWGLRVPRPVQETLLRIRPVINQLSQRLGRTPTAEEVAHECHLEREAVAEALLAGNAYRMASIDASVTDDDTTSRVESLGDDDPGFEYVDQRVTVTPLLADVSERDRRVLHMRFFEDMTQSDIAEQIGVSQMQVSRILSRTLADLRERSLAS